jgi:high affinity Mn2+ porin
MRILFCATAMLCAVDAAAEKIERKRAAPPVFTFAGFHIGGAIGAGFPVASGGRLEAAAGFGAGAFDLHAPVADRAGPSFGAQVGYDWRQGDWIYGVEADLGFLDLRRGSTGLLPAPPAYGDLGASAFALGSGASANYYASVRGRLGYAFDRRLFYGFAGVATGGWRGESQIFFVAPGMIGALEAPISRSSRMKFVVGAGVEQALFDQWSARLEYIYLNQQSQTRIYANDAFRLIARQRSEAHMLRLGLDYRFALAEPEKDESASGEGKKTEESDENGAESAPEYYGFHWQTTGVMQGYPRFPALHSSEQSFPSEGRVDAGATANLFFGARLWQGASAYLNPEIDVGYALANSVGAAAFVNGAAVNYGRSAPYMRLQRYFLRQIIGLGGVGRESDYEPGAYSETLESAQNQLAGKVRKNRVTFTIGKFAVPDVFDENKYAHDPTTGFMNIAVNSMGAFDNAADWWGYTYGAALEWKQDWWTARAGLFQLSQVPRGPVIEPRLGRQLTAVGEFEARYELFGEPGVLRLLAYGDNGYFALVDDVVSYALLVGEPPDVNNSWLRRRNLKLGGGINLQQQISEELGFFLRASMADGRYEAIEFTDIDRSLAMGLVASGSLWGRESDEIGAAAVISGLDAPNVRYFALGGQGIYIGDGAIAYAGEKVLEAYYKYNLFEGVDMTLDYQLIGNPAHNFARGPVNVFGLRLHAQF